MKNVFFAIVLATTWLVPALVFADPKMPDGFVATWTDDSGLSWRETGSLPQTFSNAVESVKATMKSQGYSLRHDIFDKAFPDQRLFLFLKGDEETTVMLWRIDAGSAGLSWGVTRTSGSESPAEETISSVSSSVPLSPSISTNTTESATLQ